ncbi:MAG: TPM domain-containing protein [Terracidiphilus sp.]
MKGFFRRTSNVFRLLLAVSVVFSAATLTAQSVDKLPKPTDYVSDFAHVLSPDTIARIDRICTQLDHSQANAQIAVVTVQTLDGEDAAEYANQLEDQWKIGRKGSDRGVLILLAIGDHKRRIEVGYGLEGILPDGKLGDIGREMVPQLRANDFDGAVTLAVDEIAQTIATDAKVTLDDEPAVAARPMPQRHSASAGKIILIIILLLFFGGFSLLRLLASFGLLFGGWGRGPWIGGGWGGGGFGGGGFGGGGGGGGSGFGGFGGGSFGGGGAGGSW